jgi:thiol-disulfide isomerase/thioredoxin
MNHTQLKEIAPQELDRYLGSHELEIVDISTTWCPPCQALKNKGFPALFNHFKAKDLIVYGIDGDEAEEKMGGDPQNPIIRFNVSAYPTCIIFYKGKQIDLEFSDGDEKFAPGTFMGFWNEAHLIEMFETVYTYIEKSSK